MNTSELLHSIAKDRVEGMRTIDSFQLKPTVIVVTQQNMSIVKHIFFGNAHKDISGRQQQIVLKEVLGVEPVG